MSMITYDKLEITEKETYTNYLKLLPDIWLEELNKLASNFFTTVNFKDRVQQPVQNVLKTTVEPIFPKVF